MKTHQPAQTDNYEEVMQAARDVLPADVVEAIEASWEKPHPRSHLIEVLHKVQQHYRYLPGEQLDAVAQLMQIPAAQVTGVASFYHYFRLEPRGLFVINVCLGTACYVKGAEAVVLKIRDELGIDFGQTTSDGVFTLDASRCLGCCGLAPVVMVNEKVHANVTPDEVPRLLRSYMDRAKAQGSAAGGRGQA